MKNTHKAATAACKKDSGEKAPAKEKQEKQKSAPSEFFRHFARQASCVLGSPWAFCIALLTVVIWAVLGPVFEYSETWQLVINTGTTIVTFLMVFLIQNTQNRDVTAIHLKLDELLRAVGAARTGLVDLEDLSDQELKKLQKEFEEMRRSNNGDLRDKAAAVTEEIEEISKQRGQKQAQSKSAKSQGKSKRRPKGRAR